MFQGWYDAYIVVQIHSLFDLYTTNMILICNSNLWFQTWVTSYENIVTCTSTTDGSTSKIQLIYNSYQIFEKPVRSNETCKMYRIMWLHIICPKMSVTLHECFV